MTSRINLTTTDVKQTRVALNVFDSVVEADGITVVLSFIISSQEEFGEYQFVVANNVMPAARRAIEIVPGGITLYTYNYCVHVRLSRLVMEIKSCKTLSNVYLTVYVFQMYLTHLFLLKSKTSVLVQRHYHGQKVSMAVLIKLFTMKSALTTRTRPGHRFEWALLEFPKRSLSGRQQSTT